MAKYVGLIDDHGSIYYCSTFANGDYWVINGEYIMTKDGKYPGTDIGNGDLRTTGLRVVVDDMPELEYWEGYNYIVKEMKKNG